MTLKNMQKNKQKLSFEKIGPMKLPSRIAGGTLDLHLYTFKSGNNYFTLKRGNIVGKGKVLFRINSNCVWADIFGSARCDCAEQLHEAMRRIVKDGEGLMIHAYNQDGRGLSLKDHVRVYMEQDKGYDTIEADRRCGFENPDRRNYGEIIQILKDFEIKGVRMLTNNPHKISSIAEAGIKVEEIIPIEAVKIDKYNIGQLYMKKKTLDHDFYSFDLEDPKIKKLFKESLKKWSHGEYDSYMWKC
ncbi:MAG: GTP cyclohydrolase II RibA [Candidatus Parcubacteria bacterium]|nr:GTP cyclohydrolase II RibA [Candidatus Parcubacteria bacterium]